MKQQQHRNVRASINRVKAIIHQFTFNILREKELIQFSRVPPISNYEHKDFVNSKYSIVKIYLSHL